MFSVYFFMSVTNSTNKVVAKYLMLPVDDDLITSRPFSFSIFAEKHKCHMEKIINTLNPWMGTDVRGKRVSVCF